MFAETNPCVACESLGTVKRMPQFDEFGELIEQTEVEVVAKPTPAPKPSKKPAKAVQRDAAAQLGRLFRSARKAA